MRYALSTYSDRDNKEKETRNNTIASYSFVRCSFVRFSRNLDEIIFYVSNLLTFDFVKISADLLGGYFSRGREKRNKSVVIQNVMDKF